MHHQITITQQDFTNIADGQPYLFTPQIKSGYRKGDFAVITLKDTRQQIRCEVLKVETDKVNGRFVFLWLKEESRDLEQQYRKPVSENDNADGK